MHVDFGCELEKVWLWFTRVRIVFWLPRNFLAFLSASVLETFSERLLLNFDAFSPWKWRNMVISYRKISRLHLTATLKLYRLSHICMPLVATMPAMRWWGFGMLRIRITSARKDYQLFVQSFPYFITFQKFLKLPLLRLTASLLSYFCKRNDSGGEETLSQHA